MSLTAYIVITLVKILLVLGLFSALAGLGTYFERKVLAFMQRRLGPMHVGPYGLLQVAADGIKLFTKEDIVPQNAIKPIFKMAPVVTAATAFMAAAAIPFFPPFTAFGYEISPVIADINIGILYVLGVMAVGYFGPLMAGLSSYNKWSLLGAARTVAQLISFEVVTGLSAIAPIMLVGSLSLVDINDYQAGGITHWLIWQQPLAFVLFLISAFAETNRTPFHIMETEHEIVSGFATEYSGLRWGMFFIGEYANMFFVSFLVSIVFLGGYGDGGFLGFISLWAKVGFFFFLFLWVRAAWPHVRPDQLMWLCWKVLAPLAVLNILLTAMFVM